MEDKKVEKREQAYYHCHTAEGNPVPGRLKNIHP